MDAWNLVAILERIGWKQRHLATLLSVAPSVVARWAANGTAPPEIMAWLDTLAAFIAQHPPPGTWAKRRIRRWQVKPGRAKKNRPAPKKPLDDAFAND